MRKRHLLGVPQVADQGACRGQGQAVPRLKAQGLGAGSLKVRKQGLPGPLGTEGLRPHLADIAWVQRLQLVRVVGDQLLGGVQSQEAGQGLFPLGKGLDIKLPGGDVAQRRPRPLAGEVDAGDEAVFLLRKAPRV